jgi:hypothetical protein
MGQSGDRPQDEYGPWERGNMGQVGRTVTKWVPSLLFPDGWMPVVDWEPHPDEVEPPLRGRRA